MTHLVIARLMSPRALVRKVSRHFAYTEYRYGVLSRDELAGSRQDAWNLQDPIEVLETRLIYQCMQL